MKRPSSIVAVVAALALTCTLGAGCAQNQSSDDAASNEATPTEQSATDEAASGESSSPLTVDQVADGTYSIDVDSSSSMFRVVKAELTVENGSMSCVLTLSGTGYGKLFMGTSDEAAAADESECIPFVEDADGAYTYTVPVEALDKEIDCAAWSIRKEQWYDRTLVFESASLPTDASQR